MTIPVQSASKETIGILVVDDDPDFSALIKLILKKLGYSKVMTAIGALSALQKIESGVVDFVLCDFNMPGLSGVELLENVRRFPEYRNLPFVFLTSEDDKTRVIEAIKAGAMDYILKTSSKHELTTKLTDILNDFIGQGLAR